MLSRGAGILLVALATSLWLQAPTDLRQVELLSLRHGGALPAWALGLAIGFAISLALLLRRWATGADRALGLLSLLAVLSLAAWTQRFTDLGVLAAGGARFWVDLAAAAPTDADALAYLSVSTSATQYGVHSAHQAINRLPAPRRSQLLRLLASLVRNEFTRREILEDAEQVELDPPCGTPRGDAPP